VARGGLGRPFDEGALVVSNHISWLDVVAVNAVRPMRAVAKAEIAGWPVLGRVTTRAGTLFADRERLSALPRLVADTADVLRRGSLVHVCAEGTTWCGRASGRFATAPFQAAIDAGVAVRPVALRYRIEGGRETTWPAFIGDGTLLSSVRRVARVRGLVVEVLACPQIPAGSATRRELATLQAEFEYVAMIVQGSALAGARFGNAVLIGSTARVDVDGIRSALQGDASRGALVTDLEPIIAGALPLADAEMVWSPAPEVTDRSPHDSAAAP
jgi:1-acyl-sn-glycerol-3-phosphate acyltransferase